MAKKKLIIIVIIIIFSIKYIIMSNN